MMHALRDLTAKSLGKVSSALQKASRSLDRRANRLAARNTRNGKFTGCRLDIGCGPSVREGYIGCDVRRLRGVELVCCAWEVDRHCRDLQAIHSRHTLEHLTWEESRVALKAMFNALVEGGELEIVVPNMDFHIEQFRRAEWSDEALDESKSDGRWSMAGFYGWQRGCDPAAKGYERSYWDVHKSGYNTANMPYFLRRAGFGDIEVRVEDDCHLVATARKTVNTLERQVSASIDEIRADHLGRYRLVDPMLPESARVLDAACGVGYGTALLADGGKERHVVGVDIHEGAVEFARENYTRENNDFDVRDITATPDNQDEYDAIVSFETLEHVDDPNVLLANFAKQVRVGGQLIVSTPNEETMPFDPKVYPYHTRHFTPADLKNALSESGFSVKQSFSQHDRDSGECRQGWDGLFLIAVCERVA